MAKKSAISKLTDHQHFYVSLIARLNAELVEAKIITPTQRGEISRYIQDKIVFNSERKTTKKK